MEVGALNFGLSMGIVEYMFLQSIGLEVVINNDMLTFYIMQIVSSNLNNVSSLESSAVLYTFTHTTFN